MKKIDNLLNILQELKDDYFEGALTDSDVANILMDNIDEIDVYLAEYRELKGD